MDNGSDTEVVFKADNHEIEDEPETEVSAPPNPITHRDMDIIIRGWEEKFQKMLECLNEVQRTSERASSDMCLVSHEARAQARNTTDASRLSYAKEKPPEPPQRLVSTL